jgi:hypothetical protein
MDSSQLPALIGLQFFLFPAAYFVWAGVVATVETRREIGVQNSLGRLRVKAIRSATMREMAPWLFAIWVAMNVLLLLVAS